MFKRFFKALTATSVYNQTYNELSALTDKDLRDIGLTRGDIHTVAVQAQEHATAAAAKAEFKAEPRLFEVHP